MKTLAAENAAAFKLKGSAQKQRGQNDTETLQHAILQVGVQQPGRNIPGESGGLGGAWLLQAGSGIRNGSSG